MTREKSGTNQRGLLIYTLVGLFIITGCVCAYKIHTSKFPVISDEDAVSVYDINDFTVNFANGGALTSLDSQTTGEDSSTDKPGETRSWQTGESEIAMLININTATAEELMKLKGIGEIKAAAIIEYRNENGKFNNISELLNVSGIGQKIFESIRENITV